MRPQLIRLIINLQFGLHYFLIVFFHSQADINLLVMSTVHPPIDNMRRRGAVIAGFRMCCLEAGQSVSSLLNGWLSEPAGRWVTLAFINNDWGLNNYQICSMPMIAVGLWRTCLLWPRYLNFMGDGLCKWEWTGDNFMGMAYAMGMDGWWYILFPRGPSAWLDI